MIGIAKTSSWFPQAASTHAQNVDGPFYVTYAAALLVVLVIVGLAVVFILQYGRKDEDQSGAAAGPSSLVGQGLLVAAALALAVFSFTAGFEGFLDSTVAPHGAYTIEVTARQGDWDFTYPGGHVADTLQVPIGRPVRLTLKSEDVVHGLAIPAFRIHQAVLPEKQSEIWFEATAADTFALRNNIFSGGEFAAMQSEVIAHRQLDFEAWLNRVSDIFAGRTMAEVGELLYNRQGCKTCHTTTGLKLVGPSFLNMFGYEFDTREGERITVNEEYIKESILYPNVSVIAGYEPAMTPYEGKISDKEIEAITVWLKTLSDRGGSEPEPAAGTDPDQPQDDGQQEGY